MEPHFLNACDTILEFHTIVYYTYTAVHVLIMWLYTVSQLILPSIIEFLPTLTDQFGAFTVLVSYSKYDRLHVVHKDSGGFCGLHAAQNSPVYCNQCHLCK